MVDLPTIATTTAPPALSRTGVVPGWRWITSRGEHMPPASMATTHLFFTLRMIWNHSMPRHMHVGYNVKRWRFGIRHRPSYMRQAIVHLGAELFTRTDLPAWMQEELRQMAAWFGQVSAPCFISDARALMLEHREIPDAGSTA